MAGVGERLGIATMIYLLAHEIAEEMGISRSEATTAVVGAWRRKSADVVPWGPEDILEDLNAMKAAAIESIQFNRDFQMIEDHKQT